MIRDPRIVILAALLVCSACTPTARPDPTPSPIPDGTTPLQAILGREPTDRDCFTTAFDTVSVPDAPTLQRHVVTVARSPAWLPHRGFLGSPAELARAVNGQVIAADPQTTWILVPGNPLPRAERYFPLTATTGERIWYREGSVSACI